MPVPSGFPRQSAEFDPRILKQLACPVCFGALRLVLSDSQIACIECQRAYPLIDGIPVLIPGRATGLEQK
jgi:uncharacterized protein YbaR (Trm112 family)